MYNIFDVNKACYNQTDKFLLSYKNMLRDFVIIVFLGFVSAVVPEPAIFSTSHVDNVVAYNVTPLCLSHTTHWMSQLRQGEPWALKMLDSMTKIPSGIKSGNKNHLGTFDQCLSVSVNDDIATFKGQYFRSWGYLEIPKQPLRTPPMVYAFCVPSSCSMEELPQLMRKYIGPALGIRILIWSLNPLDFHIMDENSILPIEAVITVALISVLVGVVLLCALVEWHLKEKTPALVRACSLTSTCRSLFNTRKHPSDISCLHGLRVGSMLWIILGHRYGQERWVPLTNTNIFKNYFSNPLTMTVANAMPSVETFFFLSGMLACTSFFREVQKNKRHEFDIIKFYIYRYFRLALPIGIVTILYITLLPLIGDGPLWNDYFHQKSKNCKVNWWTNMIFVNNYIYKEGFSMCLGQTWYTAVDMQLAWLSPLVLLPLYHSPRAGLQLMTLLILISCFIPFTLTYIYHFPMSSMQVGIDIPMEGVPVASFERQMYNATHSRSTPYLCGMLYGYYFYKTKAKNVILSKIAVYLGWTCSTVVALTVIYSLAIPHQPGYVYNLVGSAFYAGFHRLAWSAVIAWIIFACSNGFGGAVDKILSWNLLLPLSRLTYCAFLMQFIIIIYDVSITRTLSYYSDYDAVHDYFGDLIPAYFISFLLYILVEGPVLASLRIVFSKGKGDRVKK